MAGFADVKGDPGSWEAARELGKQLKFPVGPFEARVPTPDEMNAVLPYIVDRMSRFAADKYFCENAEITMAHVLGINVPRQGFPDSSGYNRRTGRDWEGYSREGFNEAGYNREGFNRYGFNKDGYDKDGYNQYGFDRDGFNKKGRDRNGHTRNEAAATLVNDWSEEMATAIAAVIAQLDVAAEPEPAKKATRKRATVIKGSVMKATPKKAAARKAPPRKLAAAAV